MITATQDDPMSRVYVGIGGNIGDRFATLRSAIASIASGVIAGTSVVAVSPVYETHPVGPSHDPFLNAVIELHTTLVPRALLRGLLAIEAAHGRQRRDRWEARTVDLDILVWLAARHGRPHVRTVAEATLAIPHPLAPTRDFVLAPLADLTGDTPLLGGRSARALLRALPPDARTILSRIDDVLHPLAAPALA